MSPAPATSPLFRPASDRPRARWLLPLGIAAGLHLALLLAGRLSRHDTLLDLIAQGGTEAVAPSDPQAVQEAEIVDLTSPPPEANPDFIVPQEETPPPDDPLLAEDTSSLDEPEPEPALPPPPAPVPVPPTTPELAAATPAPATSAPVPQPAAPGPDIAFAPSGVRIGNRDFPKPPYPYEAKLRRCQGVVLVSLNIVDGVIVDAAVEKSSGFALLDRTAVSWIRRKWHFPSEVTRSLSQPIAFELAEGA